MNLKQVLTLMEKKHLSLAITPSLLSPNLFSKDVI